MCLSPVTGQESGIRESGIAGGGKGIPLLISDHHGDHALWLINRGGNESTALLVLDAHADTEINRDREAIRAFIGAGDQKNADRLLKNHNWIHPLTPGPVNSLAWISRISGTPDQGREEGFWRSTASWGLETAECVNVDELDSVSLPGALLFVSIDLDFFYYEDYTARDIPPVFNRLLEYSEAWNGDVLWALCTSLAWLPGAEYAWELLEQSLAWLAAQEVFAPAEITMFTSYRYDTSRRAESFRAAGMEAPGFYLKEGALPETVRNLFLQLQDESVYETPE
jgi:hypothetical protein